LLRRVRIIAPRPEHRVLNIPEMMNNNPIIGLSCGSDNDDNVISIFIAINYNLLAVQRE